MILENKLREKALQLGYEDCGIIKVGALAIHNVIINCA